jgi:predicted small secreted protein
MKKIIALLALATVMTACDKNIEKINRDVSSASALSTPSTETISAAPTTCPASDNLPPFATDSATFDDSNGPAVDVILDNNQAYTEGPWFHSTVISGYYSNDYIYAKRDSEVKSVMTWNWTAPTKGFYNIYENHTADSNRSPKASFKVVKLATVWLRTMEKLPFLLQIKSKREPMVQIKTVVW